MRIGRRLPRLSVPLLLVLLLWTDAGVSAWSAPKQSSSSKTYRYFGFGSNVLPSTMKALRQISVQDCAAAILPGYELKFYGSGKSDGKQLIESSAAFVEPSSPQSSNNNNHGTPVVHGVVYTLSEEDFVKVGRTEGVPLAYRWQQCFVYPYVGDGEMAGQDAVSSNGCEPVEAYTLIAPPTQEQPRQQVAPSASYLGLIREGAELWQFDRNYQDQLASVEPATNLIVSEGISGPSLQLAEKAAGISRAYKIRVPNSFTSKKSRDT